MPVHFGLFLLLLIINTMPLCADQVVLVAGGGTEITGPAVNCQLRVPFGLEFDRAGNLYAVEMSDAGRVLKIDAQGALTVLGGTGVKGDSGDGGSAAKAQFNGMHGLALSGNVLFIADTLNNRIRKIDLATSQVSPFAGTWRKGFSGDNGPALTAEFGGIYSVAFDQVGENLYLVDLDNRRVRVINTRSGTVRTVAGNGEKGVPVDGSEAIKSPLVDPRAAAIDSNGNLYILERGGNALRVIDRHGRIRTVAGTGRSGSEGDGGEALKASFNGPKHICIDLNDNVIIADTDNNVIRKYLPKEKKIVRVAGSGRKGSGGVGGPASNLELNQPHGVQVNRAGILYIADSLNNRILRIQQ